MPGVSASGRSSYVTVADSVVAKCLSTDLAGLGGRGRALSTLMGLATDPEEPGNLDREVLGESDRFRRDPCPWARLEARSRCRSMH
eukprot:7811322-Pyramimonas_sp.AAC.1